MWSIFPKFRRRVANALFNLSEKAGGVQKSGTNITAKNKFAVTSAVLGSYIGYSRRDGIFFRCEYDLDEIKRAADTENYLAVAIKKYSELFMKAGYSLKGSQDAPSEYLRKRFKLMSYLGKDNVPFPLLMRETAYDLVKFSNAFWVKNREDSIPFVKAKGIVKSEKCVGGYSRLDPAQVRVQFDKDGKLCAYKQITPTGREKVFALDDVVHFVLNRPAESIWGVPFWIPTLEDIRFLRVLEGEVATIAHRFAAPIVHAKVGLPQEGMYGTKKEVDETRQLIENTPPDGMIISPERLNFSIIGAEGNALDLKDYLAYFESRVFTGLNTSSTMMGRGGSKQDADSMEEQVHNAVKDMQAAFAIQFQDEVITELLLEGGFNPILKEEDDVDLVFNEINLDTRVKLENHIVNLYHANAITVEEMRSGIGYKVDGFNKDSLYSNYIEQTNTLEQIDVNHDNAIELAKLNAQLNKATDSASTAKKTSSTSKKGSSYTKKNTGNGKNTSTGKTGGAVKAMDKPSNQYGTYSAKIKESIVINELSTKLTESGSNSGDIKNRLKAYVNDMSVKGAKEGYVRAMDEIVPGDKHEAPSLAPQNSSLIHYFNKNIDDFFSDINKNLSNTGDECGFKQLFESRKYRLEMLTDFVYRKSYWYSYLKACESHGVKRVQVHCRKESRHSEQYDGKIINPQNFNINDIPGYSTNCGCYLEPLENE